MSYAPDWTAGAYARALSLAVSVRASPVDMAGVWMSESGCHSGAHNPNGDAAGLCQMMPATLTSVGFLGGWQGFTGLSPGDQLPWMNRYYRSYTGRMLSPALAYLATFLPAYLTPGYLPKGEELGPETVIAARGGRLGWAYSANAVFDENLDGSIQLYELGDAIARNAVGERWDEIASKLATLANIDVPAPTQRPSTIDLGTIWGAQRALTELTRPNGAPWYAGPIDGIVGPITRGAIIDYQRGHLLDPVGYVGPLTKRALEADLESA